MIYPLISEYIDAIRSAEDNFDQLSNLHPVLDNNGLPVMSSGDFAVVFKMRNHQTGKLHALKCFLKEKEGRAEAYRLIAEELEYVNSTYLTPIRYFEKGLFVNTDRTSEKEFPMLLMDWVEGKTLDKYIREHIDSQYDLAMLVYQFSRLAMWLMPQPFAHGNLKPDNILVKSDGTLVLVDYDGMYVPAMQGQKARELGSPNFRHPLRTEDDFNEHIDDFPLMSILLSLKAISLQPKLLWQHVAADCLLFSERDYRKITHCKLLKKLFPSNDTEQNLMLSLFMIAFEKQSLSDVSFRLLNISRPKEIQPEELSTEVTEEDLKNAWEDEYGVKYSPDGKRLLKGSEKINGRHYKIKKGVIVVCNAAFIFSDLLGVSIPDGVITIGDRAFSGCDRLTSIRFPKSLSSIGYLTFSGCGSLTSIRFPKSLTAIPNYAIIGGDRLIPFPQSLVTFGDFAFSGCDRLASIQLPDRLATIGDYAFSECYRLTSITLPNSVTTIGNSAFYGCALTSITIPDSVSEIKGNVFRSCRPLKSINVSQRNRHYSSIDGVLYNKGLTKIISFPSGKNIDSWHLPDGVTTIGNSAFENCKLLAAITIPDGVISIGDRAFSGCALTSITIPNSVSEIKGNVFQNCRPLKSINVSQGNHHYSSIDGVLYNKGITTIISFPSGKNIDSWHLPDSVTTIGDSAFAGCQSLKSITLPDGVTTIGNRAFSGCYSLASIHLPDGVTTIGNYAFENCKALTAITIPNGVITIGDSAFYGCDRLASIHLPDSVTTIGDSAFHGCALTAITIPDGVTTIGNRAFSGCDRLTTIHLPNGLATIGDSAFDNCKALASITIPDGVTTIGNRAFSGCDRLISIHLPDGLATIGDSAFDNCKALASLAIPDGVTSIGNRAFSGCGSLTSIHLPDGLTTIGDYAFAYCYSLTSITIPDSVTSIGNRAFSGCGSLTSITIPDCVAAIGYSAFAGCQSLTCIIIRRGTNSIFGRMLPSYKDILHEE